MKNSLKELREHRGWTQGSLADHLGVSRQTVNALETGRYDPSLPLAFRLSRLFELPIEQLFDPEDVEPLGGAADPTPGLRGSIAARS